MSKRLKQGIGLGMAVFFMLANIGTALAGNVTGVEGHHIVGYWGGKLDIEAVDFFYKDQPQKLAICPTTETMRFASAESTANPSTIKVRYNGVEERRIDGTTQYWPVHDDYYEVPFEYDKDYTLKYKDYEIVEFLVYDTQDGSRMSWLIKFDSNLGGTSSEQKNTADSRWVQDSKGWWIQNADGSYLTDSWYQDPNGKWYYMGTDGYMLVNTITPDGYKVGADGVWVQ